MRFLQRVWVVLALLAFSCSKYNASPSETNPGKLADETILYRLCVKGNQSTVEWRRVSTDGLNAMTFNQDRRSANYTANSAQGGNVFSNLIFDLQRNGSDKTVTIRFFKNGLMKESEIITYLSADTLKNEPENHVYVRQ